MGKPKKINKTSYSQREIGEILNNAIAAVSRPEESPELTDQRLRKLRAYAQAVIEAPLEHVDEGLLTHEELVFVLTVGALFTHLRHVQDMDKLPFAGAARELYKKD